MTFALYTLGLRYCHVAAMRSSKLRADGVISIEESYDVSANVFSPVDQRKKAPPMIALEPRTLELVRRHRRYLTQRGHRGLKTGLLFPSEAGTRPVGNDQLNDVWREVRQASTALMELVPTEPTEVQKGRDLGRDGRGRDRNPDEERAAATAS